MSFTDAFERVVKHYGCTPEERELMRLAALDDRKGSRVCFAALVAEIDAGLAGDPAVT